VLRTSPALLPPSGAAAIREEVLQRAEQIAAETSPHLLCAIERFLRQHVRKELVRQLARSIILAPLAAEESDDRWIICLAELSQRVTSIWRAAVRLADECPAGGVK
jgi:hypothetical protein